MTQRSQSRFFHDLQQLFKGQSANKMNMEEHNFTETIKITFYKFGYLREHFFTRPSQGTVMGWYLREMESRQKVSGSATLLDTGQPTSWLSAWSGSTPQVGLRVIRRTRFLTSSPRQSSFHCCCSFSARNLSSSQKNTRVETSVVDPNTLNLDPDSGFWPNLDPDPDPGLY